MHHTQEFKGQSEQEIVLFASRAHWAPLVMRMVVHVLAWGIVGLIATLVLDVTVGEGTGLSISSVMNTPWLLSLWSSTILTGVLYVFTLWYLTLFVITDTRLITFVQASLFSSYAIELKFANIRDSSYAYRNPLHYIFNYGVLIARSSPGAIEHFEVPNIANPRDLHHYVHKLITLTDEARRTGRSPDLPTFRKKWGGRHMRREQREAQRWEES